MSPYTPFIATLFGFYKIYGNLYVMLLLITHMLLFTTHRSQASFPWFEVHQTMCGGTFVGKCEPTWLVD